ncbi:protein of unknown function [Georgfuchsia toluolica]|uniref:Uncharacterized protein n=1 Tax=Georgfuchsia toluolica TaxID=424218 RepID=A0A916N935_9PROT|nr:protein of unknown function [Georgfuchsia toluolica]
MLSWRRPVSVEADHQLRASDQLLTPPSGLSLQGKQTFNVEVSGLRGFSRRSARLKGYASGTNLAGIS